MTNQPQRQTPTPEERLKMAVDALEILGINTRDPRYHELYRDWAHNLLGIDDAYQPDDSLERTKGVSWISADTAAELDEYLTEFSPDS